MPWRSKISTPRRSFASCSAAGTPANSDFFLTVTIPRWHVTYRCWYPCKAMVQPRACQLRTRSQKSSTAGSTSRTGSRLSGTTARIGLRFLSASAPSISGHTVQFIVGQMSSNRSRYCVFLISYVTLLWFRCRVIAQSPGSPHPGQYLGRHEQDPALDGHRLLAIVFQHYFPSEPLLELVESQILDICRPRIPAAKIK